MERGRFKRTRESIFLNFHIHIKCHRLLFPQGLRELLEPLNAGEAIKAKNYAFQPFALKNIDGGKKAKKINKAVRCNPQTADISAGVPRAALVQSKPIYVHGCMFMQFSLMNGRLFGHLMHLLSLLLL